MIVGRKSENSLYRHELATYEEGRPVRCQAAAQGFIKIHGLAQVTQAKHQMLKGPGSGRLELPSIIPPEAGEGKSAVPAFPNRRLREAPVSFPGLAWAEPAPV